MKHIAAFVALVLAGCSDPSCPTDAGSDAGQARECLVAEPNNAGLSCATDADCAGANPGECNDMVCVNGVCDFARAVLGQPCNGGGVWSCTEMMQCCVTVNGLP